MTNTQTYIIRTVADGDYGYEDSDIGSTVIERAGEWVADFPVQLSASSMEDIERAAATALGAKPTAITATPVGGDISGDTSTRNTATRSTRWRIKVGDAQ